MAGRVLIGVFTFILLCAFAGSISLGIKNWRTDDVSQSAAVNTGAGVTSANVTLTRDLFNDEVTEVQSISSTLSETPAANNYTSDTNVLNITGLLESQSRTLTIVYYSEIDDTLMGVIGPFLSFLIIGGCAGAILFYIWKGRHR